MVGDAVVLDHRAVAVGATVQAFTVAVGRINSAVDASQSDAVGELARGAEQDYLFIDSRRVPVHIGAGPQSDPRQPTGQQFTSFYAHTGWFHLSFGNSTEADEVFEHSGEGWDIVHAPMVALAVQTCSLCSL